LPNGIAMAIAMEALHIFAFVLLSPFLLIVCYVCSHFLNVWRVQS